MDIFARRSETAGSDWRASLGLAATREPIGETSAGAKQIRHALKGCCGCLSLVVRYGPPLSLGRQSANPPPPSLLHRIYLAVRKIIGRVTFTSRPAQTFGGRPGGLKGACEGSSPPARGWKDLFERILPPIRYHLRGKTGSHFSCDSKAMIVASI